MVSRPPKALTDVHVSAAPHFLSFPPPFPLSFWLPLQCGGVTEDMNHKFALMVAENKRLQAQLAKAQADIQRLTRVAENLATRVSILEANTGVQ